MPRSKRRLALHPQGEAGRVLAEAGERTGVGTFGGRVQVKWHPAAQVTVYGLVTYVIEFLKTNSL